MSLWPCLLTTKLGYLEKNKIECTPILELLKDKRFLKIFVSNFAKKKRQKNPQKKSNSSKNSYSISTSYTDTIET